LLYLPIYVSLISSMLGYTLPIKSGSIGFESKFLSSSPF
jgi:hypothetical protein